MNKAQKEVLRKIIYAVETGSQVYGQARYDDFTEAYTNSSIEHSITIGAGQWYADEARKLLQRILENGGGGFTQELRTLMTKPWTNLQIKKGSQLAQVIQGVISTNIGKACQDAMIDEQMEQYCKQAEALGVTEPDAQAMCANFCHQGGYSAMKRVISKTNRPYTLDNLYQATLSDTGNQVGAYRSRQKMVYDSLKKYMPTEKGANDMTIPEKACQWMENLARDDSHGYDQAYRWGERGDYDCSSAVISAYKYAGVPLTCTYTGDMKQDMLRKGFTDVTAIVNRATGYGMNRGDVLLNEVHHTAMYCGDGKEVEASVNENGRATGGKPGDQTGREILIRSYRNYPWDCVLRYTGGEPAKYRPTLRAGDKGEVVKEAQRLLNDNGADLDVDGDFGKLTLAATIDFQARHMLEADGIIGQKTWYALDHQIYKVKKTPGVIRKQPVKSSKRVERLDAGTEVRVYEIVNNDLMEKWCRIADGWIIENNLIQE